MDHIGTESYIGSASCHSDDGYSSVSSLCDCNSCKIFQHGTKDHQILSEEHDNRQQWIPRHRLIKWSLPPPPVVAAQLPGWRSMPFGLETYWQSAFAWFFRPFFADHAHVWTMEPTDVPPMSVEWPWHSVNYSAKVRFLCPQEKHGWTSMKGRVQFWFRMRRQGSEIMCEVLFRLFGQECSRCQPAYDEKEFVSPLWYPEEIENAFLFLSTEVSRIYYGGLSKDACVIRRIRKSYSGSSTSHHHHDPTRCQACLENQCTFSVAKNGC